MRPHGRLEVSVLVAGLCEDSPPGPEAVGRLGCASVRGRPHRAQGQEQWRILGPGHRGRVSEALPVGHLSTVAGVTDVSVSRLQPC